MDARAIARQLAEALKQELDRSERARASLVALDVEGLMDGSVRRESFNERSALLATQLEAALSGPRDAELGELLGEIRALSGALHEVDALNRFLAERTLACVRAWSAQLAPRGQAYDRRGARVEQTEATHSEHA